jgi:Ca2+-binding EF-hand superfamily protein
MSITINGTGVNSLASLQQQLGLGRTGRNDNDGDDKGGFNISANQGSNPLMSAIGGGNDNDGDDNGGASLMAALSGASQTGPAMPTINSILANAFQSLMDAMFKAADTNGTGKLDKNQFASLISKMDPNGQSGVKAGDIFSAMDPNNTGYVTKEAFDAAISGMLNQQSTGAGTSGSSQIASAMSQTSVQATIVQYQMTSSLISNSIGGSSGTNDLNSLLNVKI